MAMRSQYHKAPWTMPGPQQILRNCQLAVTPVVTYLFLTAVVSIAVYGGLNTAPWPHHRPSLSPQLPGQNSYREMDLRRASFPETSYFFIFFPSAITLTRPCTQTYEGAG